MRSRSGLLVTAFALLLAPASAVAQLSIDSRLAPDQAPVVMAHRSAVMGGHPENTLAWIAHGLERGVDILHVNPQVTADGQYILMHDSTLNRTTDVETVFPDGPPGGPTRAARGGQDYVRDYTLAEIGRLHVLGDESGDKHPVPTLAEAIALVNGQALLALGLKSYDLDGLAAELAAHDRANLILFELYYAGTDQSGLRALAERSGLPVSVTLYRSTNYLADLEQIREQMGPTLRMVSVGSRRLTPEFLTRVRELGLHMAVSGWNGPEDSALVNRSDPGPWLAILEQGYSAITDQPDAVLELLSR